MRIPWWPAGRDRPIASWITPFRHTRTSDPTADSAVKAKLVAGGPNAGLWYVGQLNGRLEFHAQALKDFRPDGNAYTFAFDSITRAACQDSLGTKTSGTVTQVNLQCQLNPNYSAFYTNLWRHEGCHATLAFQKFEDLPDPITATEGIVARDSGSLVRNAFLAPNGLQDTSQPAFEYTNAIDVMGSSQYTIWIFNPGPQTWWRDTSFVAHDYIVTLSC